MTRDAELLALARDAAHHAYAPYSHFPVGAALLTTDGAVFTGCNVENASYGLTLCAERNAATTMVTSTSTPSEGVIEAIAIVGLKAAPCWPCGACRQVLREFNTKRVIVEDDNHEPLSIDFESLLPYSFGPDHLPAEKEA